MSIKLDRAAAADLLVLAQALPDSDRPDAGSAVSSGLTATTRRDGLLASGMKRIGNATFANVVVIWATAGVAGGVRGRVGSNTPKRLAAVMPGVARRSWSPRRCFGWPAS